MTLEQTSFLDAINSEYSTQTYLNILQRNYSTLDRILEEYKMILRYIYTYILNDYFNVISEDDTNFCTEDEAEDIMNSLNELNNTSYWVTPEITDYAVSSNVWDDARTWVDADTWYD
jgi:hypothetical protein